MHKIYCFSLFDTGYISVHSLIRELFNSPKTICPSLSQGNLLYVLSKNKPIKFLHHNSQDVVHINEKIKKINLETHVAFCNRHRKNAITKKYSQSEKIYPKEALNKFCFLSGLEQNQAHCEFLGPRKGKEGRFNIHNAFHIQGLFNIFNHNKFNQALQTGVGSRKSYGYGLILIKQGGKHESTN